MRASQPWYEVGWSIVFRLVRASFTALEDYQRLILVREKTLESPLDSREIKPANFKGNQS